MTAGLGVACLDARNRPDDSVVVARAFALTRVPESETVMLGRTGKPQIGPVFVRIAEAFRSA